MAVKVIEKSTSRKYTTSPTRGTGEWTYTLLVEGEAFPELAINAALLADAPFFWYGLARQELQVEPISGQADGGNYSATIPYLWELSNAAAQDPTHTPGSDTGPGGGDPSGTPTGPASDTAALGPNVTLEIGGRPPKLMTSIKQPAGGIVDHERAGGGAAPNHGLLINYNGQEVEGVEIEDPASVLTIEITFDYVTMGFISRLEGAVWHKNHATWYRRSAGSVAFIGATISSDANSRAKVNFRFGLRSPQVIELFSLRDEPGKQLPWVAVVDKCGWDYLEIEYEDVEDNTTGVTLRVARPAAFRLHEVLPDFDFALFGIGS